MTAPHVNDLRDDPADCKCGRPLAGDNDTGVCYECARQGGQSMRYRVDWQTAGYRIIDTTDGGVVYVELLGKRSTELLCEKMNEIDSLTQNAVPDCPHNVRERDAHVGNPTCAHCSVADECTEVLPF